jgi:hypothetical protein
MIAAEEAKKAEADAAAKLQAEADEEERLEEEKK